MASPFPSFSDIAKHYDIGGMLHAWIVDDYWLTRLIFAVSYLAGMFTIFRALYYLKVYGEARTMMATQSSVAAPIAMFVCGASLIFLPTALDVLSYTLYNTNTTLAYDTDAGLQYRQFLFVMGLVVQLIGLIAVVRGFLMLTNIGKTGGNQPGHTAKALTHVIGGIMAVNFSATVSILGNLFGGFWL